MNCLMPSSSTRNLAASPRAKTTRMLCSRTKRSSGERFCEPEHRAGEVLEAGVGERVVGEARRQCFVAVNAAATIFEKRVGSSEEEPEPGDVALQAVVQDAEQHFVVGRAGLRAVQAVGENAHLVDVDQQPGISGEPRERREELQVIVELGVVDDRSHVQVMASLGLGAVFGPQPAQGRRHQVVVVGLKALDVAADDGREVEAADQVLKGLELGS